MPLPYLATYLKVVELRIAVVRLHRLWEISFITPSVSSPTEWLSSVTVTVMTTTEDDGRDDSRDGNNDRDDDNTDRDDDSNGNYRSIEPSVLLILGKA